MARILVVDDDASLRNITAHFLRREGYEVTVANDGLEALQQFSQWTPHLIVLDIGMPRLDGLEVCRRIRATSDVPIVMLTARVTEVDKVTGLDEGADDYLTKPFSVKELAARIRALLRRAGTDDVSAAQVVSVEDLTIDFRRGTVTVQDRPIRLTQTEFRLLRCLASRTGEILTGKQLVKMLHNYDCGEQEGLEMMRMGIHRLRHKLEQDPANPRYIHNVRGIGYIFGSGEAVAAT